MPPVIVDGRRFCLCERVPLKFQVDERQAAARARRLDCAAAASSSGALLPLVAFLFCAFCGDLLASPRASARHSSTLSVRHARGRECPSIERIDHSARARARDHVFTQHLRRRRRRRQRQRRSAKPCALQFSSFAASQRHAARCARAFASVSALLDCCALIAASLSHRASPTRSRGAS